MDLIKSKVNDESRLREIGLGLALSILVATPANSKVLPLSNQLTLLNTQTNNLFNSINNSDRGIYINNVDNISILLDNLPQKGDNQRFPILTNQISPLTPILEQKLLTKKHQKKFTGRFIDISVSSTDNEIPQINTLKLSELIASIQNENYLELPTSGNSLTLLPPIEKRTLISRHELLKKKLEVEGLKSQNTENKNIKEKHFHVTLANKNLNKKTEQSQKSFQEIQGITPELFSQNQAEKSLSHFNLSTLKIVSNSREENVAKPNNQIEQKLNQQSSKIFRTNEIQQPLTIASALYQPDIVITNFSENIRIAQQIIQVTNIEVNTTEEGIEIVLETLNGEKLQLRSSVDGNTLIANIPNAVLALPDAEEFSTRNPIKGITNITARTIDGNSIRVTIEGETDLPTAAIVSADEGLTLSVNPVTDEIEVVISATRTGRKQEDIPRSTTVINREQIESQGAVSTTNSLTDVLGRLVPGYGPPNQVERGARAQNMRGRPALILIDGVVQNSNVSGSRVNIIDPSAIERIEVIRGPSSIYGTGGSGGIINIITREPTEFKLQQQTRVGINDSIGDEAFPGNGIGYNSSYSFSGNQGIFDWRLQTSLNQNNRLYDADGDVIPSNFLDGARSLNFLTKLGVDISEDQKLAFNYNVYNDRIFSENLSDPAIVSIPGIQKARELRLGKLDYEEIPETTNHNVSATYNDDSIFWGSQLYTQFFFQQTDSTSKVGDNRELISLILSGIEVGTDAPLVRQGRQIESKVGTRFQINTPIANNSASVRWGFDYTNERNDNRELFADPVAFDEDREVNITESLRTSPSFVLNSLGIFAEGNWDVNQKLILSGGARYEKIYANIDGWQASPFANFVDVLAGNPLDEFEGSSSDASDLALNFGVLYKASSAISFFANFSQGFSIPSLSFLNNSDPGDVNVAIDEILEPEKVDNYEIGVRGTWDSVQFTVAGYYNHADKGQNLFLVPGELITQFVRTPQRNYGVEATLDWQPANTWNLGGTLTWMEGEGDFLGTERSWQPLSTLEAQPMKLTFYLENQTLRSWKNRLQLLYVTNRDRAFDDGVDQVRIAGYTTVDFISVLDTGFGRLEVGIENLLNHQYFPVVAQLRSTDVQEQRHLAAPGRSLSIRYFLDF